MLTCLTQMTADSVPQNRDRAAALILLLQPEKTELCAEARKPGWSASKKLAIQAEATDFLSTIGGLLHSLHGTKQHLISRLTAAAAETTAAMDAAADIQKQIEEAGEATDEAAPAATPLHSERAQVESRVTTASHAEADVTQEITKATAGLAELTARNLGLARWIEDAATAWSAKRPRPTDAGGPAEAVLIDDVGDGGTGGELPGSSAAAVAKKSGMTLIERYGATGGERQTAGSESQMTMNRICVEVTAVFRAPANPADGKELAETVGAGEAAALMGAAFVPMPSTELVPFSSARAASLMSTAAHDFAYGLLVAMFNLAAQERPADLNDVHTMILAQAQATSLAAGRGKVAASPMQFRSAVMQGSFQLEAVGIMITSTIVPSLMDELMVCAPAEQARLRAELNLISLLGLLMSRAQPELTIQYGTHLRVVAGLSNPRVPLERALVVFDETFFITNSPLNVAHKAFLRSLLTAVEAERRAGGSRTSVAELLRALYKQLKSQMEQEAIMTMTAAVTGSPALRAGCQRPVGPLGMLEDTVAQAYGGDAFVSPVRTRTRITELEEPSPGAAGPGKVQRSNPRLDSADSGQSFAAETCRKHQRVMGQKGEVAEPYPCWRRLSSAVVLSEAQREKGSCGGQLGHKLAWLGLNFDTGLATRVDTCPVCGLHPLGKSGHRARKARCFAVSKHPASDPAN